MYRFRLLIVLLVLANLSWAQTPDDLIRDVRENTGSTSRFMNALQKHAQNLDSANNGWYDTTTLLGHTLYKKGYRYNTSVITVHAVYRGEQLGYVRLIADDADTVFKYVNHDYTAQVLNDYNAANNTDFTWRDLYEDDLNYFGGLPGLYEKRKIVTEEELQKGIWWELPSPITDEYEPILIKRDHETIIKHCRSFNPARKAYGAYCLYILKNEGVPLSEEEKKLFDQISHSNETTELHAGCLGYRNVRLSSFLCREHLDPTCDELRTPDDLVYAVQSNPGSASNLLRELKKLADEKAQKGDWKNYDIGPGLLDHKRILQRFNYHRRDWAYDSVVHSYVMVEAVYKENKVRYVRLVECYNNNITGRSEVRDLFRYVDSAYAKRILLAYNKKHGTHVTLQELFEDSFKIQTFPL